MQFPISYSKRPQPCECADPGCPVHEGSSACKHPGVLILYRVDMHDETGTAFCNDCADDAERSGLFGQHPTSNFPLHDRPPRLYRQHKRQGLYFYAEMRRDASGRWYVWACRHKCMARPANYPGRPTVSIYASGLKRAEELATAYFLARGRGAI